MSLQVSHISPNVEIEDLHELFGRYGVVVPEGFINHLGIAIITFEDERDAEDALDKMNGKEISGSRINVEWASRDETDFPPNENISTETPDSDSNSESNSDND